MTRKKKRNGFWSGFSDVFAFDALFGIIELIFKGIFKLITMFLKD